MSLETRIIALAQAIGADVKALNASQGTLSGLSTTAKSNLVAAINELVTTLGGKATINDTAGSGATGATWSADKILAAIDAAKLAVKNDLVNGAGATLDTLNELATALGNDPSFATNIATQIANRVRYDAAQSLTLGQQQQVCGNIGVGDPDHNFVTDYTTAKA